MVFNAILLQIIKCGKILAIVLLLLFSFLSVLHISYTTVQCYIVYFLRFFELHMVEWSRRQCTCMYIRSSRLCDDEALLAFAREGVE